MSNVWQEATMSGSGGSVISSYHSSVSLRYVGSRVSVTNAHRVVHAPPDVR
jgi:hypothetical protein